MANITRPGIVDALNRALEIPGGSALSIGSGVSPVIELMSLDDSAFPTHRAFTVEGFQSAAALNWGYCRIGLLASASQATRLLISRIQLTHNDAGTTAVLWTVRDTGPGPVTNPIRAHDFDREPAASVTPARFDSRIGESYNEVTNSATDPFGGLASNAFQAFSGSTYSERNTQIVLRPGQELVIRNVNVNMNFGFKMEGRVYGA